MAMDLYKAIRDLYVEKEELDRVIATLEKLQRATGFRVPPAPDSGSRGEHKSIIADDPQ
jgi:hypothetical protein